MNKKCKCIVGL